MEDNTTYITPVARLESDDGLGLSISDIVIGNSVIWKYKGVPYKGEILYIYGKPIFFKSISKRHKFLMF